jgi:hypothetical protein
MVIILVFILLIMVIIIIVTLMVVVLYILNRAIIPILIILILAVLAVGIVIVPILTTVVIIVIVIYVGIHRLIMNLFHGMVNHFLDWFIDVFYLLNRLIHVLYRVIILNWLILYGISGLFRIRLSIRCVFGLYVIGFVRFSVRVLFLMLHWPSIAITLFRVVRIILLGGIVLPASISCLGRINPDQSRQYEQTYYRNAKV